MSESKRAEPVRTAKPARERLDVQLVERSLAPTREKAQALILTGDVLVNDQPIDKPGTKVPVDAAIRLRGMGLQYVGRGGEKLAGAIEHFALDLVNTVAIDIGASTGGFTDCMLQRGASLVYAIDVGYNQLAESLRRDGRVRVMERTHAKDLTPAMFAPPPHCAAIDVSFISARKVLEFIVPLLAIPAWLLVLVKPQFELDRESIGKGGVVRSESDQLEAVRRVSDWATAHRLLVEGYSPSVLRGGKKGNQEYFLLLRKISPDGDAAAPSRS